MHPTFQLNGLQIESVIRNLVPLIAEPKDYEFFTTVLELKAENSSSGEFALFIKKLLDATT